VRLFATVTAEVDRVRHAVAEDVPIWNGE